MKFCLDRFENNVAVCLCEEENAPGTHYDFALSDNPALAALSEGTLFEATLVDEHHVTDVVAKPDETQERLARATARLHALAARTKKKKEN